MTAALPAAGRPALTLASTLAIQMLATAATLSFAVLAPVMPGIALTSVGLFLSLVYVGGMAGSLAGAGMVAAWEIGRAHV